MPVDIERRRILLAARPSEAAELRELFCQGPLERWDLLQADSFGRARFLLQHNPCDILLVDESLCHEQGPSGLAWLALQPEPPIVLLAGMEPDTIAQAYEQGVSLCVPRRISLDNCNVLAAALKRTARLNDMQLTQRRTEERLGKTRRQVDRLVNLLWRSIPMDSKHQWFTHRHVLERLQEEVARCGRHGDVFTLALGEVEKESAGEQEAGELSDWTSSVVSQAKRRCDVAGYYGMHGFMLLMVQTPKQGGVACCKRLQNYLHDAAQKPNGPRGPIRTAFGISSFGPDNATTESLLSHAERHLKQAKAGVTGGLVAD